MRPKVWWIAFGALSILALLPILLPASPPFFDVPNHLARAVILSRYDHSPFYQELFRPNWRVLPNLAMDVLLLGLCRLFAPLVAVKILLSFTALFMTSGFAALHRQIYGRLSLIGLAGFGLIYTLTFFMGFMNFSLGVGCLYWTVALYLSLDRAAPPVRFTVITGLLFITFFAHAVAFVFTGLFGILIAYRGQRRVVYEWGIALASPIALFLIFSPTVSEAGTLVFRPLLFKGVAIGNLWRSGFLGLDLVVAPALLVGLGLMLLGNRGHFPRFARPLVLTCIGLFLLLPFGGKAGQVLDTRIPLFIAAALLLAIPPEESVVSRFRTVGESLFGAGVVIQMVSLAVGYRAGQGSGAALLDAFAQAPRNSFIFLAVSPDLGRRENGPYLRRHANDPGLALTVNDAYVSDLFTIPTQQPLIFTPRGASLSMVPTATNDAASLGEVVKTIRTKMAAAGYAGRPAYLQYAAKEDAIPVPIPGTKAVLARPGLGLYRVETDGS